MAKSRGFPLKGKFSSHEQFQRCWDSLSANQKVKVREKAEEWNLTLKDTLNRWPALRVEAK